MASGTIPFSSSWFKIAQLVTSATTSDVLKFAGDNERHLIIAVGPRSDQNLVFITKTSAAGVVSHIIVGGDGNNLTFTDGTRTLTIAHNSASMGYIDFVIVGSALTL